MTIKSVFVVISVICHLAKANVGFFGEVHGDSPYSFFKSGYNGGNKASHRIRDSYFNFPVKHRQYKDPNLDPYSMDFDFLHDKILHSSHDKGHGPSDGAGLNTGEHFLKYTPTVGDPYIKTYTKPISSFKHETDPYAPYDPPSSAYDPYKDLYAYNLRPPMHPHNKRQSPRSTESQNPLPITKSYENPSFPRYKPFKTKKPQNFHEKQKNPSYLRVEYGYGDAGSQVSYSYAHGPDVR